MYALIGDIHSNIDALKAVYADIKKNHRDARIICLGDLVGYNASPNEVIDFIRKKQIESIMGNHDAAVLDFVDYDNYFNYQGISGVEWAKKQIEPENIAFLKSLNTLKEINKPTFNLILAHGSPRPGLSPNDIKHTSDYIFYKRDVKKAINTVQTSEKYNGNKPTFICVGHTHVPRIGYTKKLNYDIWFPLENSNSLINPGSVGQPRDHLRTARYALLNEETQAVKFRSIKYNRKKARKRIIKAHYPYAYDIAARL